MGRWISFFKGESISPTTMKRPLPENFRLEYDLATDEFSSSTGGSVHVYLSSFPDTKIQGQQGEDITAQGVTLLVEIESGNSEMLETSNPNYAGSVRVSINSKPSLNVQNGVGGISKKVKLSGFTDKRRKIHVAMEVNQGKLTLWINDELIMTSSSFKMAYGKDCEVCAIPAGTRFRHIRWMNKTEGQTGVYIGNVKIRERF